MRRRAVVFLAAGAVWASAQAITAPTASADRPVSDFTCASGEPATYDRGRQRFSDRALVLGCIPLAAGARLQLEASDGDDYSAAACFFLTGSPPVSDVYANVYACPKRFRSAPKVLLILRHPGPMPITVMGIAPRGSRHLGVRYFTDDGARRRAHADRIRVRANLADRAGAPRAFGAFVVEIGRDMDVCQGIKPRAIDRTGSPTRGQAAVPGRYAFGRPGGWLAGFTQGSWGIGVGPDPKVCVPPSPAATRASESRSAREQVEPRSLLERLTELLGSVSPWQ